MTGRISAPTERALKLWKKGASVYALAKKVGLDPSSLYKALKRAGKINGKNGT